MQLTCCCCGGGAPALRQWWNRDRGFGICGRCVKDQRAHGTPESEIRDYYGEPGIHWFEVDDPTAPGGVEL